ncbi:dTDP-4-dehydrorhamnose 3,5-epimerase family protein [Homoserinibacter sp. GY 40078]|uniref:dTDP-4-dehydrorhamnose 3,5-epimerase family protein n=1 Tax=Homoserinibacter sp. GY 40078 TaxID=2603275 RepID=UPI0011C74BBE|nr:dTDP-4-dehydrorhamnose 3,5-epimerase [Homoserinibacter sp. GY 40078]TXK16245.1 dTDP-4-keto-6-deoxy-D-glucose epimerase [Homoserinibacter sp. GY 40078]
MRATALDVPHAVLIEPVVHRDARGEFLEWFRADRLAEATGRSFELLQANLSVSSRGTVRGVHFADVPRGQAKYVTVVAGSIVDILVDLRVGSPEFGRSVAVELDSREHRALFVPEGVGHLFAVTSDEATVCYLATDVYKPESEHTVSPFDPELALAIPDPASAVLSTRDAEAPMLAEARERGLLPDWEACLARYAEAATGAAA